MAGPLSTTTDDVLGGIDDDLRREFQNFTGGQDPTRRGLARANFDDVGRAAEALVEQRVSRALGRLAEAGGAPPGADELRAMRARLTPEYTARLNQFGAAAQARQRAGRDAERANDVGALDLAGSALGQAATGLATGVGRLFTLGARGSTFVQERLGIISEETASDSRRMLDDLDQNITDFREGVQQEIALPGAAALQRELTAQAEADPDAGFGTSAARSIGTVLRSPYRTQYLTELLSYAVGVSAAGGLATGAIRGAATAGAQRIGSNVAVGTAARLNGTTSIALGQAAVGAGEVGEEVRQQYLELDRQGLLPNLASFQEFYDTIDSGSDTPIPYEEARDRFIRSRAAAGRALGGVLTGVTTFIAPSTEAAMLGFGRALSGRGATATGVPGRALEAVGTVRDALPQTGAGVVRRTLGGAGREAFAEGAEEVGQQAIPNFVGGLDQDEVALGQAAAAGILLGGIAGGGAGALQRPAPPPPDPLGLPAPPPEPPAPAAPQGSTPRDALTARTDFTALESELAARFARAPETGVVVSAQLAAELDAEVQRPSNDSARIAELEERVAEERAARPRTGLFSTTDADRAAGLPPEDGARLRGLVTTGDFAAYLGDADPAERQRLTRLAQRYANSTAGDGDPITNVDLAVRAANDPRVLGPVGDVESVRADARLGAEAAQAIKRVNVAEAGFPAGDAAVFGRASRTGDVGAADLHRGAYPPSEAYETFYSDPDGRDFAVSLDSQAIAYREPGQDVWQVLDPSDSARTREALTKGYAAALGPVGAQDNDLITVLDAIGDQVATAAQTRVQAVAENEFTGAAESFVIEAASAAAALGAQQRAAQDAAVAYLTSPQAVEAWRRNLEGAGRNVVLPPTNLPATARASDYIQITLDSAAAELDRLQAPFFESRPGVRLTKVRASLNRSEDLRLQDNDDGIVASGSAQMNAFVRELAGTGEAVERAALANRVIEALNDGGADAEVGGVSLTTTADGFFVESGPAGTLRSTQPTVDLLAVAHATFRRAVREQRLERLLDRDLAVQDGEVLGVPIDQSAVGAAFRRAPGAAVGLEFNPQATPLERERGAQAVVAALRATPGINPLGALTTPADADLAAIEGARGAVELAAQAAAADPALRVAPAEDVVARIDALPDGHLRSGTLHGLRTAANRLARAHQYARSAPATARQRFTNTMARLRYEATAREARTGERVESLDPTPAQMARIEAPAVIRARHMAWASAEAARTENVEERIRAAKYAVPGIADADVVIALGAPPTAAEINTAAALERDAQAVVDEVIGATPQAVVVAQPVDAAPQQTTPRLEDVVSPASIPFAPAGSVADEAASLVANDNQNTVVRFVDYNPDDPAASVPVEILRDVPNAAAVAPVYFRARQVRLDAGDPNPNYFDVGVEIGARIREAYGAPSSDDAGGRDPLIFSAIDRVIFAGGAETRPGVFDRVELVDSEANSWRVAVALMEISAAQAAYENMTPAQKRGVYRRLGQSAPRRNAALEAAVFDITKSTAQGAQDFDAFVSRVNNGPQAVPGPAADPSTRFKLADPNAITSAIPDDRFRARVRESRERLRGQNISIRPFDTFDEYLADVAQTFDGTTSEDAVRQYVASIPRFAGQFSQKADGAEVVLIREAIPDEAALERVLAHEIVGHYRLADIVGPAEYSRLRRTIQTATPRLNTELYNIRRGVERTLRESMRQDPRYSEAEATRLMKTSAFAEQIADEVIGELAERVAAGAEVTPATNAVVDRLQRAFDAAGLPTRNAGTRYLGRMLQMSRDTSFTGAQPRMIADASVARASNAFQRDADRREFTVLDESWLQRQYRRGLNSVAYLGRLANATRALLPANVGQAWDNVRLAEDRANRIAKAEEDRILPHIQRVTDIAQQIFDNSGMGRAEFDAVFMGWMNARDYLDRVPNLVLTQMVSGNAAYNQRRTEVRERIIEEGESSPAVGSYISDLRRAAQDTGASDILAALDPGSPAWRNLTGYTHAEIREMLDSPQGVELARLAGSTNVGGQRLDEALTGLREAYYDAERKSGTRGERGVALARALGITHYMPQEARAQRGGVTEELAATFRASNPELARDGDGDLGVYDLLKSRSPLGFEHDVDPFATRPRNDFLSPLRGSPEKPTTPPLVLLATKANSVAGAVATQDLHRALRDAALLTQEAEANGDGTTQFSRAVEIIEDFDLTTDEGRADFRKLIARGDVVLAMDQTGDATALRVRDRQLLRAITDRHITQARIEQHALRRTAGQATRAIGRVHTSLSPTFVVFRQFVRDLPEAILVAAAGEQSFDPAAAARVGTTALGNLTRISPYIFGSPARKQELLGEWRGMNAGTWQREFARFVDNGGEQAFSQGIDDVVSGLAGAGVARQRRTGARTPFEAAGDLARTASDAVLPARVTGRDSRGREAVRGVENFANLFDNATRFALFSEVRQQRINRREDVAVATANAVDVSNSLLPFNRRSELARAGSSFYAFFNVALASTDVAFTRRIWRGGSPPVETFQTDAGRVGTRLASNWAKQLNWPLATFLFAKGFLATTIALHTFADDEEDGPEAGRDRFQAGRYMDSTPVFGAFIPDQLGVPGAINGLGASMALALASDYDWDEIIAAQTANLAKNLTPLNYDSGPDSDNPLADIARTFLPTALNLLNEQAFDTNRFNAPISRLRDEAASSNATPQSTSFSPGVVAMSRELEDAMEAVFGDGARVDPGNVKWMFDQLGDMGAATRTIADKWVAYSTGEPIEVVDGLARMTRAFPRSAEFTARTGFYRYADEIERWRNDFKEAAKDDIEAGDAPTDGVPAFSSRSKGLGPRTQAVVDALPDGFWGAKKAHDARAPRIGAIKQEVDNIRRAPEPDAERIGELLQEEVDLYRDALDLMRDVFDDGYDAQLVF